MSDKRDEPWSLNQRVEHKKLLGQLHISQFKSNLTPNVCVWVHGCEKSVLARNSFLIKFD